MSQIRAAIVATYPPRRCGLASFSFDLLSELVHVGSVEEMCAVAIVKAPGETQRPEVVETIRQGARSDYPRAARALERLEVDVVLLQHEYGIFGGEDGEDVLAFARALSCPLVVTLHTVLSEPSPHQLEVLTALCGMAELVIVMTPAAVGLLDASGACDVRKVRVVPHGAPALLGWIAQRSGDRAEGRSDGRFLLSTFGLISPGKGIEAVIEAMPFVVERHPEVLYLIGGRTHPDVVERDGERYRRELERRVAELGLEGHVRFDDRYLPIEELGRLLAGTDVFVTPYRNRDQIASGALTFAIAAGCAAISTPYWYAQDILSSGAGKVVPFNAPRVLSEAICEFVEDPVALAVARAEARRLSVGLSWPEVARSTATVLQEALSLASRQAVSQVDRPVPCDRPRRLPHPGPAAEAVSLFQRGA